ncbi:MAG: Nif3-like dinuclear metal center hexameric protein, partial [Planctomycetota bacterium]|nr:Nif3-like dinuclear metal center hexameric protein [Planctomycetota bacterium]
ATVFLTGEMKHHEQLQALRHGMSLILAGHTNTERGVFKPWTKVLQKAFPDINIKRSRRDRHPLRRV